MDIGVISVRYARALIKAALGMKLEDQVYQEMQTLYTSYIDVPELRFTIDNPMLSKDKKQALLTTALGRPTGLLDPEIEVRPVLGQIDDLIHEVELRAAKNERVLVTTLTKKMAEDLTDYLAGAGIRVRYMHSDIGAIERMEIVRDLRKGEFDVLVGINLLREGLDMPEVSLVAILDADKEGFLRSETSLIQTIGRAARNAEGKVILYADAVTPSMRAAMDETERRRRKQDAFNKAHGIVPKTIVKPVHDILEISESEASNGRKRQKKLSDRERREEIAKLEKQMREASKMLEFEYAAVLRDRIIALRGEEKKK